MMLLMWDGLQVAQSQSGGKCNACSLFNNAPIITYTCMYPGRCRIFMITQFLVSLTWITLTVCAYDESLRLQSFGQGLLLADFSFTQSIKYPLDDNGRVFGTFPKPMYEIFHEYKLQSIRLTMSKTRWMYEKWGEPEWDAAPLGVSLNATFNKETPYGKYPHMLFFLLIVIVQFRRHLESTGKFNVGNILCLSQFADL